MEKDFNHWPLHVINAFILSNQSLAQDKGIKRASLLDVKEILIVYLTGVQVVKDEKEENLRLTGTWLKTSGNNATIRAMEDRMKWRILVINALRHDTGH
ncbi:hypothetical protein PoB_006123900 [Plakobranchus ocellatus]|uniref:Uncharacterized protein n=1 Tax=Plakobranchus ocellatus TaxID=259542 RepID=A0AAV4CSA5_9GAST|nr:hypothetical protein PoB_006123900 [Plakobranchus ocellatus]